MKSRPRSPARLPFLMAFPFLAGLGCVTSNSAHDGRPKGAASTVFMPGQTVVLKSTGLGKVQGIEKVDLGAGPKPYYKVVTGAGSELVPVGVADESMRVLVGPSIARQMLAVLRSDIAAPASVPTEEDVRRSLLHGDALEQAHMLRLLYVRPRVLTRREATQVDTFEDLVLGEIAHVTKKNGDQLEHEMRAKYRNPPRHAGRARKWL